MAQYFPTQSKDQIRLPIYLKTIGTDYEETLVNRPMGFPAYQWIQCVSGSGIFQYDQKEIVIRSGQGIFIYPNVAHSYYALEKPWKTHWVSFDGYSLQTLLESLHIIKTGIYDVEDQIKLGKNFYTLYKLATSTGIYNNLETSAHLFQFLIDIAKSAKPIEKDLTHHQKNKLEPVLKFIEENYFEPLTIEDLAAQVHVTPQYLCVLFSKFIKKRPFEYVNQVRVNKSKELILTNRNMPIAMICKKVGFESPSYYGGLFKKLEGITPGQFKGLFE